MAQKTQKEQILNYLQQGNPITPVEALNLFGCFRLGARIYDLRKEGYEIENETPPGELYARYFMKSSKRSPEPQQTRKAISTTRKPPEKTRQQQKGYEPKAMQIAMF